ncbi:MAG: TlpA disulfide reductase family protein [Prevotellaceae bacterium]|nr:TlpA disulfide reductase family protein [Prevotellaceae bacterium]
MRSVSTIVLLLAMAFSAMAQQKDFTINGTSEGVVDGDTVYLCQIKGFYQLIHLDSAIVKDGSYQFKGNADELRFLYVVPYHEGSFKETGLGTVLIEPGEITLKTYLSAKKKDSEVKGGVNTELWKKERALRTNSSDNEAIGKHWKVTMDSTATIDQKLAAQAAMDSLRVIQNNKMIDFIIENMPVPYCDLMLGSHFGGFNIEQKERILDAFAKNMPEAPQYKKILAENAAKAATADGQPFIDFEMADVDGKMVKMSDIVKKNKYTLIDFWASWCGPCRAEMPNVVEAYNRFHDKGFEVVGVSLDSKRDDWVKAIDKLGLPWIQVSDVKGWQCEAAAPYNVKAIPANFLIDQNGTIITSNLRGLTLVNTIASLLE